LASVIKPAIHMPMLTFFPLLMNLNTPKCCCATGLNNYSLKNLGLVILESPNMFVIFLRQVGVMHFFFIYFHSTHLIELWSLTLTD
jgi:hypothetical protein